MMKKEPASYDSLELSVELRRALDSLSREEREIVLLSVLHGYKSHEIAEMLEISPSTVRSKLKRSLAKLQNQLGGNT